MEPGIEDLYLLDRRASVEGELLRLKTRVRNIEIELQKIDMLIDLREQNREMAERLAVVRAENDQIRAYLAETDEPVFEVVPVEERVMNERVVTHPISGHPGE